MHNFHILSIYLLLVINKARGLRCLGRWRGSFLLEIQNKQALRLLFEQVARFKKIPT